MGGRREVGIEETWMRRTESRPYRYRYRYRYRTPLFFHLPEALGEERYRQKGKRGGSGKWRGSINFGSPFSASSR
jgi:hypothetical protein